MKLPSAGVVMKLMGGFFLWFVIVIIFARYAAAEAERDRDTRRAQERAGHSNLTYEDVTNAFESTPSSPERN